MHKLIPVLPAVLGLIYIASCVVLYTQQRRFLYFPTSETEKADADALFLKNQDVTIKLWKLSADSRRALIYFGGNAEDVARNIPMFAKVFPTYDVYLVNYRGYGGSEGRPSETALYADARAVYDALKADYEDISIIGRSLGSGVATYLAAQRETKRLALITPYDSIESVAQKKFPIFPVSILLKDKFDSAGRAHLIQSPTLIILAENDRVIPRRHADNLAVKLRNAHVEKTVIPGTNHLTVSNPAVFWEDLYAFFQHDET